MSRLSIRVTRCLALSGAALFVGVSASQNVSHGYELGAARSEFAAYVLAGASLGGALIQPAAFYVAMTSLREWAFGRAIIATGLGLMCLAYATLSSLGFTATSTDASAAVRGAQADTYSVAKARADAALGELRALADIRTKKAAQRRAELEVTIADAQKLMSAPRTATLANPTASAISTYAAAAGYSVRPDDIAPWLVLFAVAFIEIGASFALIVVAGLPSAEKPKSDLVPAQSTATAGIATATAAEPAGKPRGRKRAKPLEAVVEKIERADGRLEGSMGDIGQRLGLSKSSAHRALHALAAMGVVTLAASPAGTLVQMR